MLNNYVMEDFNMDKKFKIGFIGYGRRGPGMLRTIAYMPDVEVVAVCDLLEDRQKNAAEMVKAIAGNTPVCVTDYKELFNMELDAVINCASWADHSGIAIDCLNAGVPIGFEVGGAYSIDECWELVKAYEKTKTPCMMLTNSKFTKQNMAIVRMAHEGLFGKVIHCDGGYCHYMTKSVVEGHYDLGYYRLINYLLRNSENYPMHALGSIAEILELNRGNKILTVSSTASCSAGIREYIKETRGTDHPLYGADFAQGDIISTNLKCARGETISMRLDTVLPRPYSRKFEVHGTRGCYLEDGNMVYLKDYPETWSEEAHALYNNADKYIDKFLHPAWQRLEDERASGSASDMNTGHGGTDHFVIRAFIDSVRMGLPMITDVYDAAMLMAITPLSEESIAKGGAPVMMPDFTKGRYLTRKPLTSKDNFWSAID